MEAVGGYDQHDGFLYIADSGVGKIFRYVLIIDKSRGKPHLAITHLRVTVVENCGPVQWITLDDDGSLFYSASNSIRKVSVEVLNAQSTGDIRTSSLTVVSEATLEAEGVTATVRKDVSQKEGALEAP